MSGPIIRKYGFPNFDKIFGERAPEHGVDDAEESSDPAASKPATTEPTPKSPDAAKTPASGSQGKKS